MTTRATSVCFSVSYSMDLAWHGRVVRASVMATGLRPHQGIHGWPYTRACLCCTHALIPDMAMGLCADHRWMLSELHAGTGMAMIMDIAD